MELGAERRRGQHNVVDEELAVQGGLGARRRWLGAGHVQVLVAGASGRGRGRGPAAARRRDEEEDGGAAVARLGEDDAGATGHEHDVVAAGVLGAGGATELRGVGIVDKVPSKIDVVAPASPRRGRGFEAWPRRGRGRGRGSVSRFWARLGRAAGRGRWRWRRTTAPGSRMRWSAWLGRGDGRDDEDGGADGESGKGSGDSCFIARARARVLGGLGVCAVDVTAGTRGGRCEIGGTDAEAGVCGSSTSGGGGRLGERQGRAASFARVGAGALAAGPAMTWARPRMGGWAAR